MNTFASAKTDNWMIIINNDSEWLKPCIDPKCSQHIFKLHISFVNTRPSFISKRDMIFVWNKTLTMWGLYTHRETHTHVSGWENMHEHKLALAWQALSHAKGHYLAAVSSNRSIAGWETDPGSVPSLQGCTIWQLQHICVSRIRVHVRIRMCVCQRDWSIRPPLR